jgi:hypothetical protein
MIRYNLIYRTSARRSYRRSWTRALSASVLLIFTISALAWNPKKALKSVTGAAKITKNAAFTGVETAAEALNYAGEMAASLIKATPGGYTLLQYALAGTFVSRQIVRESFRELIDQNSHADPVDLYQLSWEHRAHSWQRSLQSRLPIAETSFVYSHNTFNSAAYATPVRYIDPNHRHSIYDQLRLDARWVELDVHWVWNMNGWPWEWGMKPVLCHSKDARLGCGPFDRPLKEGLKEVRKFINENRGEVIVLMLEDYLTDAQAAVVSRQVRAVLGDLVYKPEGACMDIPPGISRQEILEAGKNILVHGGGTCRTGDWGSWFFLEKNPGTIHRPPEAEFYPYPHCSGESVPILQSVNPPYAGPAMVSYQEDLTGLAAIFGESGKPITTEKVHKFAACGVGRIGLDMLDPLDGRLAAAIWSWAPGKPDNITGDEHCAVQNLNGRWDDENCGREHAYACRNSAGEWYVTNSKGAFNQGQNACAQETSGAYQFAVPLTGRENSRLAAARAIKNVEHAWLKYSDEKVPFHWE